MLFKSGLIILTINRFLNVTHNLLLAKTFPSNISQYLKFSLIPCQTKFAEITQDFFIVVVIFKSITSLAPLQSQGRITQHIYDL